MTKGATGWPGEGGVSTGRSETACLALFHTWAQVTGCAGSARVMARQSLSATGLLSLGARFGSRVCSRGSKPMLMPAAAGAVLQ